MLQSLTFATKLIGGMHQNLKNSFLDLAPAPCKKWNQVTVKSHIPTAQPQMSVGPRSFHLPPKVLTKLEAMYCDLIHVSVE